MVGSGRAMAMLVAVAAAGCAGPRASSGRAPTRDGAGPVERERACPGQRKGLVRWYGGGIGVDACGAVRRYGLLTPGGERDADPWIEEMNAAMGR